MLRRLDSLPHPCSVLPFDEVSPYRRCSLSSQFKRATQEPLKLPRARPTRIRGDARCIDSGRASGRHHQNLDCGDWHRGSRDRHRLYGHRRASGSRRGVSRTSLADSSTLIVAAAGLLAPGTYPIVVNVTAGSLSQHLTVAVVVTGAPGIAPAINLVASGAHTCALAMNGAAYCWGYNGSGQLGNNDTSLVNPQPVAVAGGLRFQSLSVSKVEDVTCGLSINGAAYCWGQNEGGQLGDGTVTRRLTPTPVVGGLTFASLAVGNEHVCGVTTSGSAYCWGSTPNGAFGDGTVGTHLTPTPTAPGMTFEQHRRRQRLHVRVDHCRRGVLLGPWTARPVGRRNQHDQHHTCAGRGRFDVSKSRRGRADRLRFDD